MHHDAPFAPFAPIAPRNTLRWTLAAACVASLSGCGRTPSATATGPARSSPVVILEDSVLTSRVKAALLLSPVDRSFDIQVDSHQGAVLLSGMATNRTQMDLAVFVALNVPGVSTVDNFMFLTAAPPPEAPSQDAVQPSAAIRSATPPITLASNTSGAESHVTDNESPTADSPSTTPDPASPLPKPQASTTFGRMVQLAHRILGIRSIQDELQIKP